MRRGRLAGLVLLLTLAATGAMAFLPGREEPCVPARIVTVRRGDVRCVAALTGQLVWQEQTAAYALSPGMVDEVYVEEGERVAQGQALIRLDGGAVERIASAWAAQEQPAATREDVEALMESMVVRAPVNGTVRQLLAQENAPVAAGAPVAVLSSTEQAVVCAASQGDAAQVRTGMQAQLYSEGEYLCMAEVAKVGPFNAEASTGRVLCSVTLMPEERLSLPAGALLEVDVLLSSGMDVPVLPVEAITDRGTVWRVYEGICTEIPVEIVLSDEMHAWVRLPEGMQAAIGEFNEGQRVTEANP